MCEKLQPTVSPLIRLVVRGPNDVAIAAAKRHGVPVQEDERLHYGRYWSAALEEYRYPDPRLPVWQTTYLLAGRKYLDKVIAWHEQSQATAARAVVSEGALLHLSYESDPGKVIARHIGRVDHRDEQWLRILGVQDSLETAESPQEVVAPESTDGSNVGDEYEP